MIPDESLFKIRDLVSRRVLGTVDESFVLSLNTDGSEDAEGRPRTFVMAGRTWQIVDADPEQNELVVAPVSQVGSAPVWSGSCRQSLLRSPSKLDRCEGGFWNS